VAELTQALNRGITEILGQHTAGHRLCFRCLLMVCEIFLAMAWHNRPRRLPNPSALNRVMLEMRASGYPCRFHSTSPATVCALFCECKAHHHRCQAMFGSNFSSRSFSGDIAVSVWHVSLEDIMLVRPFTLIGSMEERPDEIQGDDMLRTKRAGAAESS